MGLERFSLTLDRIGRGLAAICCAIMFLFLMADIGLRLINIPFLWPIEYSGFLMAFIVFLPLAGITRRREHMAADFFINSIGGGVERSFRRWLIPLANLIFAGAICWLGWSTMQTSYLDGVKSLGPLRTPMWIPQTVMVVALIALAISAIADLVRWSADRPPSELDLVKPIDTAAIPPPATEKRA